MNADSSRPAGVSGRFLSPRIPQESADAWRIRYRTRVCSLMGPFWQGRRSTGAGVMHRVAWRMACRYGQAWYVRTPRPWTLPTQPVTRALLVASGVTDAMIRTQLATGRLTQLREGVFLSTDAWPDTPSGRHLARAHAEQVANPDAVISHESAAVVWGLPTPGFDPWHESPVSLTRPGRTSHRSRSSTATWHSGSLPVASVTRDRDGYAVTSVARTAVDLAAGRALPESLVI